MATLSEAKMGNKNPAWKGDKVGYNALHEYIRNRYIKPEKCELCKLKPPLDLANRSGKYLRKMSDWWYLCRKCHMNIDGRFEKLRKAGKLKRVKIPPCLFCGKIYYRKSGQQTAKFCSLQCYRNAGGKSNKLKREI